MAKQTVSRIIERAYQLEIAETFWVYKERGHPFLHDRTHTSDNKIGSSWIGFGVADVVLGNGASIIILSSLETLYQKL
jgi:hypothetical protein